ncbi:MAG: DUF2490 domain-containing protein [Bacteroidota bacterium]
MKPIRFIALLLILNAKHTLAQPDRFGNWNTAFIQFDFRGKWGLLNDVQLRTYRIGADPEMVLFRPACLYEVNDAVQISAGAGAILSEVYQGEVKKTKRELRFHQQVMLRQQAGAVRILHRYRLEERYIADTDMRLRLRYMVYSLTPLTKKKLEDNTLYLVASDEIMLNTTGAAFDQNRLYAGLGWMFNKQARIDVGPLWQTFNSGTNLQLNVVYLRVINFRDR